MSSRWTGFFVWALVAASTAFWAIKVFAATRPVPPGAQAPQAVAANGPMERLFGAVVVQTAAAAPVHPESERFQLVGVISPGYALVAIDGQPAKTWHVGSVLDGNTSLLSVSKRGAEFGPQGGPTAFSLQLPEPATAETGTLAPAVSQPDPAQLQGQPQPQPQQMQAQGGGQPQVAGRAGMQGMPPGMPPGMSGRSGVPQPGMGRGGMQGANGIAPSRIAPAPDAQQPIAPMPEPGTQQ